MIVRKVVRRVVWLLALVGVSGFERDQQDPIYSTPQPHVLTWNSGGTSMTCKATNVNGCNKEIKNLRIVPGMILRIFVTNSKDYRIMFNHDEVLAMSLARASSYEIKCQLKPGDCPEAELQVQIGEDSNMDQITLSFLDVGVRVVVNNVVEESLHCPGRQWGWQQITTISVFIEANSRVDDEANQDFLLLDLEGNESLYTSASKGSDPDEYSDNSLSSCSPASGITFAMSQQPLCTGGNCRVEFILLYLAEDTTWEFSEILVGKTSGDTESFTSVDLVIDEASKKIFIDKDILVTEITINFVRETSVCELVVAGVDAQDYNCSAGRFLDLSGPKPECLLCPAGKYGDVSGLKQCHDCPENSFSGEGATDPNCTPCDYLQYSNPGSESCTTCTSESVDNPACLGNPYPEHINLATDLADDFLSFSRTTATHQILSNGEIALKQEGKPFLIKSVVFIAPVGGDLTAVTLADQCTKNTDLSSTERVFFSCPEIALDKITSNSNSAFNVIKMFVFGISFSQAEAEPGFINTGTEFVQCPAGTFSKGGREVKAECDKCEADKVSEAGSASCEFCSSNHYAAPEGDRCLSCGPNIPQCGTTQCEAYSEDDDTYGTYNWPASTAGTTRRLECVYNPESSASKVCDEGTLTFSKTNFSRCASKLHDQLDDINNQADEIDDTDEQKQVSDEIRNISETSSDIMNSQDVKTTTEIIDKVLDFNEDVDQELDTEVRDNVLKTVDGVHKSTKSEEIAQSAQKLRNNVEKLSDRLKPTADEPTYLNETTIAVVVFEGANEETTFSVISKDNNDYSSSELVQSNKSDAIFSVTVPANSQESGVTAILYNTPKFFPDSDTAPDTSSVTKSFSEQFMRTSSPYKAINKVISAVTEVRYKSKSESHSFKNGEMVKMRYIVDTDTEEKLPVHYKMHLSTSFQCAFYNVLTKSWVSGSDSGCHTTQAMGENGTKHVTCECDHMTSFAVLMSFESDYDPIEETVTSILLGISLGCLFFTIIAYLPAKDMLHTRSVRINLLLVVSLMFSIIVFYFMELVTTENIKTNRVPTENDSASIPCVVIGFLMNYFWLCQMAWMVCEAVVMYRALVSAVFNSHISNYMLKFNLACWGIPMIFPIIGVIWGQTDFVNPRTCFLRRKYGYVTFYGPVVLCILFNIFTFVGIAWSIFRKEQMETSKVPVSEMERRKKQFKFAITVMTLLGVAWVFGFFLIIDGVNTIWLRWLFIIFNSTQGVFIFILYVVLNDNLKKVWRKLLNIGDADRPSHSSVPYSRSKGAGTKQTFAMAKSVSDGDTLPPLPVSAGSKKSYVTMVTECDRSRSVSPAAGQPKSTVMTTSLVSSTGLSLYDDDVVSKEGQVHMYSNVNSIIGEALEKQKNERAVVNRFNFPKPTQAVRVSNPYNIDSDF